MKLAVRVILPYQFQFLFAFNELGIRVHAQVLRKPSSSKNGVHEELIDKRSDERIL